MAKVRQRGVARDRKAESAHEPATCPEATRADPALEEFYEDAPVGFHSLNRSGAVVRMNRTELGWLGRSDDEVLGHPYVELLAPESAATFRDALQKVAAEGIVRDVPIELLHRDGTRRFVRVSANAVRDAAGVLVATRSVVAEADRDPSGSRYRRLVDSVNAIVWEGDAETLRIDYVSPSAERVIGYPVHAWTAPGFWEAHLHPDDRAWCVAFCKVRAALGASHEFLYRMIAADGRVVWLHDTVAIDRPPGGPGRMYGVMVDVTAHQEVEGRLRHAYALLESSLESTADGLLVVDRTGRVVRSNARFVAMWRIPASLSSSRDDGRLLAHVLDHVEDPEAFLARVQHLYDHPEEEGFDTLHLRDGRVFERYSLPHRLDGEVVGRVWSFRDVTARHAAEAALRAGRTRLEESERRLATVASLSPVGIFRLDRDGRYVYASPRLMEFAGIPPEDLARWQWLSNVHPDDRDRVAAEWADAKARQARFRTEARVLVPDGTVRWVQGEIVAERGPDGEVLGHVGAVTDITERVEAEAELYRCKEGLEELVAERTRELTLAFEELETFSYTVSHDLRAPLRAIDGFSRLLKERAADRLEATEHDALDRIVRATTRMSRLIDDMLALCRLGRAAIHPADVDVSGLAREIEEELKGTNPSRQVRFSVQAGLHVHADPGLLRIVLENLLGNAWKFTAKRATAHVEVWAEDVGGDRVVHVRDDGVGFDPALAPRLFEPFQRLHPGGDYEGTGIGLATVRRVVERHGGRVWAESTPERGATFSFSLPAPAEPAPPAPPA